MRRKIARKSNHDLIPISNLVFGSNQNKAILNRSKIWFHRQIWHRSKTLSDLFPSVPLVSSESMIWNKICIDNDFGNSNQIKSNRGKRASNQIKSRDFKKASNQIKSRNLKNASNQNVQKSIQIKSNPDLIFAHPWTMVGPMGLALVHSRKTRVPSSHARDNVDVGIRLQHTTGNHGICKPHVQSKEIAAPLLLCIFVFCICVSYVLSPFSFVFYNLLDTKHTDAICLKGDP